MVLQPSDNSILVLGIIFDSPGGQKETYSFLKLDQATGDVLAQKYLDWNINDLNIYGPITLSQIPNRINVLMDIYITGSGSPHGHRTTLFQMDIVAPGPEIFLTYYMCTVGYPTCQMTYYPASMI
jgi:hypothetical protein